MHKPQIRAKVQNQKYVLTHLFSTSNIFQNGKTQPISTKNHGGDAFLVHGLRRCTGQGHTASAGGPMKKLQKSYKKFLKLDFKGVYFMKNLPICKKITTPLVVRTCITHQCWYRSKIKNLPSHYGLPHQMLSKMV